MISDRDPLSGHLEMQEKKKNKGTLGAAINKSSENSTNKGGWCSHHFAIPVS